MFPDDEDKAPSDDDVVFLSNRVIPDQEVLYGRIEGAHVLAYQVPFPSTASMHFATAGHWPSIRCTINREPSKNIQITVKDSKDMTFGAIDNRTAAALVPLLDSPHLKVHVSARLDARKRKENEDAGRQTSDMYRVTLNLYGPRSRSVAIGKWLSQKNVWLGTPIVVEAGVEVCNPHAADRMQKVADLYNQNRFNIRSETRKVENIGNSVSKIMEDMSSAEDIPEMEAPAGIRTELKRHQKQALWFMTQKEQPRKIGVNAKDCNSFWRLGRTHRGLAYVDSIRDVEYTGVPEEVLGGLLGDVMGLGKTLSILSLVVALKDQAEQWATGNNPSITSRAMPKCNPQNQNIKTTLLVCPLSTTSNWEDQIKEHLQEGTLSYYLYHGASRTSQIDILAKHDVVITTYSTVQRELMSANTKKRSSPLSRVNFFRIVLDEAHCIREPSTQSFQAIVSLESQRRWALTGTPIQNSLKDLGSIVRFLRLEPYDDPIRFAAVSDPLKLENPTQEALRRFRALVSSFALRRDKDKIGLPPRKDIEEWLELSDRERDIYERVQRRFGVMFKKIKGQMGQVTQSGQVGQEKLHIDKQVWNELLKGMMYMRLVCAHGIDLLDVRERQNYEGQIAAEAIDLDAEEEEEKRADQEDFHMDYKTVKAYRIFYFMTQQNECRCAWCDDEIELPSGDDNPESKYTEFAYFLSCFCLVCRSCYKKPEDRKKSTLFEMGRCRSCGDSNIDSGFIPITPYTYEMFEESSYLGRGKGHSKVLGNYTGPATKTQALMRRLLEDKKRNQEIAARNDNREEGIMEEKPIKSVIFSSWKTHLDLIEKALNDHGLGNFVSLHGKLKLADRTKVIEKFRDDDKTHIMLATLGAGGVGLNFTAASKVYIMEPHYNPAVIAQAVDRVHRIGQTREVTTVRFLMKNTIDQQVHEVSLNKLKMAEMGLTGKKKETDSEKLARLQGAYGQTL